MVGEDGQVDNKLIFAGLGGGLILIMVYLAMQSTGDSLVGVPEVQTEAQFSAWGDGLYPGLNPGTPLDMTPEIHFYDEGWNCPGQSLRKPRHRYPIVSGGNLTTVIHRGMSSLAEGSPDNPWRVTPPSEESL
jgi:hypothetical protein